LAGLGLQSFEDGLKQNWDVTDFAFHGGMVTRKVATCRVWAINT
jgi:hypothetical protein